MFFLLSQDPSEVYIGGFSLFFSFLSESYESQDSDISSLSSEAERMGYSRGNELILGSHLHIKGKNG